METVCHISLLALGYSTPDKICHAKVWIKPQESCDSHNSAKTRDYVDSSFLSMRKNVCQQDYRDVYQIDVYHKLSRIVRQ